MTDITPRGSCSCGAVRFAVDGPLRPVIACHCVQCRKATGNFVAATSAPRAAVTFEGPVKWFASSDIARRGFCDICGSQMFWDGPGLNLSIMAGAFDDGAGLALVGHIYCADKPDWYEIADGLPQAAKSDPHLTTQVPS